MKLLKKIIPRELILFIKKSLFPLQIIKYFFIKHKVDLELNKKNIKFIDNDKLVENIIQKKSSLSRYGDGEFGCMLNDSRDIFFQKSSKKLKDKLLESFNNDNPSLYIGILGIFNSKKLGKYKFKARVYWYNFLYKNFKEIASLVNEDKLYADSLITRCYIDLNSKNFSVTNFENVKKIWANKNVVIIEGEKTRMGVGNDLFSNAKTIERIICPAINAFDKYEKIFNAAKENCRNKVTLLALGPTASILASDLCNLNKEQIEYQAIDLGHLDIEYEWYLHKSSNKEAIRGKFVNEVGNQDLSNEVLENDITREYEKQIIARIR